MLTQEKRARSNRGPEGESVAPATADAGTAWSESLILIAALRVPFRSRDRCFGLVQDLDLRGPELAGDVGLHDVDGLVDRGARILDNRAGGVVESGAPDRERSGHRLFL